MKFSKSQAFSSVLQEALLSQESLLTFLPDIPTLTPLTKVIY